MKAKIFYDFEATSVSRDADMISGIYKITSPSNKIYIGQSKNIKKRYNFYKNKNCKNQVKLFNSFEKYGVNNHTFEIIEWCSINKLNIKERYWQEHYDSVNLGLNCIYQCTEEINKTVSIETKLKISKTLKEKYSKGEIKNKVPKFSKKYTKEELITKFGNRKNINHTETTRQKMKVSAKRGKYNKSSKKVINTLTKELFESITEAWKSIIEPQHSYKYFCQMLSNKRTNKTNFKYEE